MGLTTIGFSLESILISLISCFSMMFLFIPFVWDEAKCGFKSVLNFRFTTYYFILLFIFMYIVGLVSRYLTYGYFVLFDKTVFDTLISGGDVISSDSHWLFLFVSLFVYAVFVNISLCNLKNKTNLVK